MKKIYSAICFILFAVSSYADQEKVCVITNTGTSGRACSASELGFVDPCANLSFAVDYLLPTGFVVVAKYEWFVNGVSVKSTTDPTDPILVWQIQSKTTTVYCKVTYEKQDGTLSQEFPSTSFTPNVKQLNFDVITLTSAAPNYGCTSNAVSYSLAPYTCTGNFCSTTYSVGQYSIGWQAPSGWTQSSISTNGSNVSFLPDATTAGTLTATITLPCGYSDLRTIAVSRPLIKPGFSTTNPTVCGSSATYAIGVVCGAVDYTYNIVGNSGITFSSNGLQTLTTSSTSVIVNTSGTEAEFQVNARANYQGSITSDEVATTSFYGKPVVASGYYTYTNYPYGSPMGMAESIDLSYDNVVCYSDYPTVMETSMNILGASQVSWTKNYSSPSLLLWSQNGGDLNISFRSSGQKGLFMLTASNGCGSVSKIYGFESVVCNQLYFSLSPNPAGTDVLISNSEATAENHNRTFDEVRIYDMQGYMKKKQSFGKVKSGKLDVSTLPLGVYLVEIKSGSYIEKQQLIIKR
ncbi:MAG: T9SS type A sorting domain-containing protein [Flavisolibacter sp.]